MELSKRKREIYASLGSRKMRERHGLFAVEGAKSVSDSISRFEIEALIKTASFTPSFAIPANIPVYDLEPRELKQLSQLSTPTDIIAIYRLPARLQPEEIVIDHNKLYLMLDGIQDPGNLGTILRTCHWFGIDTVFCSKETADIFNPKTIQSTMGSLGKVAVCYCQLEDILNQNPELPVFGTLLDGEDIYQADLQNRGFILMGNEGKGITAAMRQRISHPLLIPPYDPTNHAESLNVAVATGVVLGLFRKNQPS